MSKKDYVLIANAIKESMDVAISYYTDTNDDVSVVVGIAKKLTRLLKADNPRFDEQRFLEACGVTK